MEQKRILALGFFDGVHLGHGALLRACRALADELGSEAGAVTFAAHPDALVLGQAPDLINTPADRERIMREKYHMDSVIVLPFDREMMAMPWKKFFLMLKQEHHAAGMVCGHDFRFGRFGAGHSASLRAICRYYGMPCVVIPQQKLDGVTISSSHIRTLLEAGDMEEAARFLGHPHFFTGTVVGGRHLGHTLGFPTANLTLPEGVACPRRGVYACKVRLGIQEYMAVANVGCRPTVHGHRLTVEPWILDFQGDLYGQSITLEFHRFLRPEQKFESLEALKAAVMDDAVHTRKFFENNEKMGF